MGRKKSMTPKKGPREKRTVNKTPASVLNCHHCHQKKVAIPCTKSDCDLNYCLHCLRSAYSESVLARDYSKWTCPRCNDHCKCKTCLKFSILKEELASLAAENLEAKDKIHDLMASLSLKDGEILYLTKTSLDLTNSKQVSLDKVAEAKAEIDFVKGQLHQLKDERDRLRDERDQLRDEKAHLNFKLEVDKSILKSSALEETQKNQISQLQYDLAATNEKLELARLSLSQYELQKSLVNDLQHRLREAEDLRKNLHSTILELKGNLRVYCRVRPPNDGAEAESSITYPTSMELAGRGIDLHHNGKMYPFSFDKVFGHNASQEEVFKEARELVQSAIDGSMVCIFAYGQTGSGKTYTMVGSCLEKGLISRSMEQVFETAQDLGIQGWKFEMKASIQEVYNEEIYDLLATGSQQHTQSRRAGEWALPTESNAAGKPELTIQKVDSIEQVSSLVEMAANRRCVARTDMNQESSRSHFLLTLRIKSVNEITNKQVEGVLNMIDLAGSEGSDKSGVTGERFYETTKINKSLGSLKDVITALSRNGPHIPFRNSKLTTLLEPYLGQGHGHSKKALMMVMVSADPSNSYESLNSLRFATLANVVKVGRDPGGRPKKDTRVDAHPLHPSSSSSIVRTTGSKMPRDAGFTSPPPAFFMPPGGRPGQR